MNIKTLQAIKTVKNVSGFSMKVEVECRSLDEGLEAAKSGADVVMFDNFSSEVNINRRMISFLKCKRSWIFRS